MNKKLLKDYVRLLKAENDELVEELNIDKKIISDKNQHIKGPERESYLSAVNNNKNIDRYQSILDFNRVQEELISKVTDTALDYMEELASANILNASHEAWNISLDDINNQLANKIIDLNDEDVIYIVINDY